MAATSNAIEAGRAALKLFLDSSEAEQAMNRFEARAKAQGTILLGLGARLGGLGAAMSAPFLAAIRAASNAQETFSKFEAVLGTQTEAAKQFLATFSGSAVQSTRAAADTFATLFSQLSGANVPADEARRSVEQLTSAVADVESFFNLSPGEGLQKFQSALAGEVEPLRRFGIELSAARIDEQLRSQGLASGAAADGADKLRARIQLLLGDLRRLNVLGDVERTAGGFANQMRAIGAASENLAVNVGNALLPMLQNLTPAIVTVIDAAARLAAEFPIVSQVAAVTGGSLLTLGAAFTAAGLAAITLVPLMARGAAMAGAFAASLAALASGPILLLTATAAALAAAIYYVNEAQQEAKKSSEELAAAYEAYAERVREAAKFDASGTFDKSEAAAQTLIATLKELATAQAQLNALEKSGKGNSDEAANLRRRIPGLQQRATQESDAAGNAAFNADPFTASQAFRDARKGLQEEITAIEAALAATDPTRTGAVAILQSKLVGKQRALGDLDTAIDPAADLIGKALTSQVEGGTAADPQARLAELRKTIADFEAFYRRIGDNRQADAFGALRVRADGTVPSAIGGREKPLLAGTPEGAAEIRREAEQRADLYRSADKAVAEAREQLLASEHDRNLARIRRERDAALDAARATGNDPRTINAINEKAALQEELAARQEGERRIAEQRRVEDRTRALQLEAELSEIATNGDLSDLVKEAKALDLREQAALADPNLTDEQRGLVQRDFAADREGLIQREAEDRERAERGRLQRRRQLDISDVFTGSIATALAIGPPIDLQQQQLNAQKQAAAFLQEIRDEIRNNPGGIPGF